MKKLFTILILLCSVLITRAQVRGFGNIDTADLKLTTCDFEKDANAMVLFDKTDITTGFTSTTILRHKRIKILNDKGKDEATIKLQYYSSHGLENISDIQAETINLNENKVEFIKVDEKSIYRQIVDRTTKKISFTFPQVKAGSVIEYTYKTTIGFGGGFPNWDFQGQLPVKYCELNATIRSDYSYKMTPRIYQSYVKDTSTLWINKNGDTLGKKFSWVLKNVKSFREEPFSTSIEDDIQRISFRLVAYKFTAHGELKSLEKGWWQIGPSLGEDDDFGQQLNENINDDDLLKQAKSFRTDQEKITYIFDKIKNNVQWNGIDRWYTIDGIKKAWNKKQGNSTEINLILYHFLSKAGIKCYPEIVSTRDNGKVNINYAYLGQFNKTVINIPINDTKYYILDASNKYNNVADVPFDILNSNGFRFDPSKNDCLLTYLENNDPSRSVVFVNAEIKPDAKMIGTVQINSFSYNKENALKQYKTDGEEKFKNNLRDNDNNLKISALKLENMEVDSLPLTQNIDFDLDLTGSDDNYIYFNPNLFTGLNTNPLLSKERFSDINFKFLRSYNINGRYKLPPGYKVEALPKSMTLLMPDTTIRFKRVVAEQEGYIIVHYLIDFKKSFYTKDEYPPLFAFYKQMHEMLNEQIVLKKS